MPRLPWVGLPTDRAVIGHHRFAVAGEKYVRALVEAAAATPVLLPSLQPALPARDWLQGLDGLLLTGAVSNIAPEHYDGGRTWPGNPQDPARDATALALLHEALAMDLPVLAICRGFQELNVALGGTLHPEVHAVPGRADHREDIRATVEVQYGPAHAVALAPGGWLRRWAGTDSVPVNSVHGQGIDRLGRGLQVEARAPDGLVEAARSTRHRFVLGVQWHPEWRVMQNPFYHAIFHAFGQACRGHTPVPLDFP
ncbi:gamma-glutamyl-gamma-aminobutyrate hydrolase family protein [Stenotrophomonas sp. 24(2023)]|uniref:gamma-glutamyl-gamma-aminobutyrate hydrolase family protein n=1 Tax=Stenotrophomonas sp. 24(2023) TaxID=3068324 RepID=UPI0027E1BC65|nr:gamma-glutamyl-gamma-aminobutyrate hydrolase family protein [Stenotrophomonas sp. 24(2023)]WMJ68565.1 gamma-glutamyl-gamma-aminobutyrate hydrolase family protein [Stenotrophomonas sp. 24(2023)]